MTKLSIMMERWRYIIKLKFELILIYVEQLNEVRDFRLGKRTKIERWIERRIEI